MGLKLNTYYRSDIIYLLFVMIKLQLSMFNNNTNRDIKLD